MFCFRVGGGLGFFRATLLRMLGRDTSTPKQALGGLMNEHYLLSESHTYVVCFRSHFLFQAELFVFEGEQKAGLTESIRIRDKCLLRLGSNTGLSIFKLKLRKQG